MMHNMCISPANCHHDVQAKASVLEEWVEHGTLFGYDGPQTPPKTGTFQLLPFLRKVFLGPWGGCTAQS